MTPRSIRRAAERKRLKLERKMLRSAAIPPEPELAPLSGPDLEEDQAAILTEENAAPDSTLLAAAARYLAVPELPATSISEVRLAANRANAQLSTGPKSAEGKAKAALNGVKTALTGRTVLLPSEDAAQYERLLAAYAEELAPVGQREADLVQSTADTMWRLRRIPCLETAIFARGRIEFAELFPDREGAVRTAMIDLETFLKYEKQLRNLQIQEGRLHRRYEKDMAELRKLQQERKVKECQALDAAARQYLAAKKQNRPFDPAAHGFEFSIAQIQAHLGSVSPAHIAWLEQSAPSGAAGDAHNHPSYAMRHQVKAA